MSSEVERLAPHCCPACLKELDAATSLGGSERPEPGSISICLYCASLATYTEDLQLRELTTLELGDLMKSDQWRMVQNARVLVRSIHRPEETGGDPSRV